MIKIPEAAKRLKRVHPDVTIRQVAFLDENFYLFVAPTGDGADFNDPYYLVGINDGKVYSFAPADYIEVLRDALDNRSVDLRKAGLK